MKYGGFNPFQARPVSAHLLKILLRNLIRVPTKTKIRRRVSMRSRATVLGRGKMNVERLVRALSVLGLVLSVSGCVNVYSDHYQQANAVDVSQLMANRAAPPPEDPIIERIAPLATPEQRDAFMASYLRRGYGFLGESGFHATDGDIKESLAVDQARELKADLVAIFSPLYTGSTTETENRRVPIRETTTETVNDSKVKGSKGTVKASDKSTTTTTVTAIRQVNVTYDHFEYRAAYFVKQKAGFGIHTRELDDSERKKLQTNKGVHVVVVVNNSPAFMADVLPDDIILTMNGQPVTGPSMEEALRTAAGQKVDFLIVRDGKKLTKTVQLPDLG